MVSPSLLMPLVWRPWSEPKSISARLGMNSFCALLQREKNSADVVWNQICAVCNGDAVYQAAAVFDTNPAFRDHLQGQRVNPVLDLEHAHGERLFAVS